MRNFLSSVCANYLESVSPPTLSLLQLLPSTAGAFDRDVAVTQWSIPPVYICDQPEIIKFWRCKDVFHNVELSAEASDPHFEREGHDFHLFGPKDAA